MTLDELQALARKLAHELPCHSVIGLQGPLGAGKTTFVQAFAAAKQVENLSEVVSPTYSLMHVYPLPKGELVHMDFYRVPDEASLQALGLLEPLLQPAAFVAVEWADKFEHVMPKDTVWLKLQRP